MSDITRKLPIGIQNFQSLRAGGYLYVDKTSFIFQLAHTGKQYFLSRPRRFGKSLFLSTLCAYWEGKKELFDDLAIQRLEAGNADAWQPYPVFYFDFNRSDYLQPDALRNVFEAHLQEWENVYGYDDRDQLQSIRFQHLLKRAFLQTGKPCVILVDEYDKPLLETLHDSELHERNKAIFRGFFSSLKSYDEYLQFVFITGVTKFSKISIFSDLNQLKDISLSDKYSAICGITEEELLQSFQPEIREVAAKQQLSEESCLQRLRQVYDGYHFSHHSDGIYNPFSLLNALDDQEFRSYWFATGTPAFLVKQIKKMGLDIRRLTDRTLYASEAALSDYRVDNPDPVTLLYQTGYLTILDYDERRNRYTLGFPNEEVKYGFLENLVPEYIPDATAGTGMDIYTLDDYVEHANLEGIKNILIFLFAGIPYDTGRHPFEHYFQTVIYLVFTLLGKFVQCELHTSLGRADCVLTTNDYIYLFEFKVDKHAEEALTQIDEKHYDDVYQSNSRKTFRIGVNFDSQTRNITEWIVS